MADSFASEYAKKKKELIAKNAANNSTTKGNISGNKTPYGTSTNSFASEYAKKKKELIDKGFTPKRKPTTKPSIPTAENNTKSGSAFTRMSDFMKNSVGTIRDGDNFASKTIGSTESAKNALTDLINRYNANSQMKADQQRTTGRLPVVPVEEQSNSYTSPREWLKDQKTYERGLKAMREGLDLADEASVNNYNEAVKAYNSYRNDEINAYNTWKGTIRSADVVKAEIDDVNAKAKELEGAKRQLRLIESDLSNIENGIPPEFYSADEIDQEYQKIKDKISSIEKDVARLPSLQDEYAYAQAFYYGDMQKNEDWQTNSVYVPKRTEVKEEDKLDFWGQLGEVLSGNPTNESRGYATDSDLLYDAINGDEEARGILAQRNIAKSGGAEGGIASGLNLLLNQGDFQQQLYEMKPEEIATYNYLYATQGTEAANKYIYDYLNDELNLRRRLGIETAFAETAQKYPIVSSIGTIALAPVKGIGYLYQAADYLSDGEMEANAGYNSFSYMSNAVREQVSEDIDKALGSGIWGSVGSWTYNLGMSMGDFVTSTVVAGGNPTLALTIMSTGAAADYTIAAKDRGLSDGQAFALGTIAGLAEAVTEKYSLEALLKPETKKGLIYILTNALTEGTEEVSSDLINTIADLIFAADKAELRISINEYKEADKNMSDGKAFGLALADYAGQLGLSFLGGFISGGTISSIYGAVNSKAKKEFVESNGYMSEEGTKALVETGLSLANDTEAYKLASEIQQKLDVGERVSPKELYALIEANEIALESEEKTAQEADARLKEEAKVKEARLAQETEARLAQETEARIEARAKEQTSLHVFSPDYINEVAKQTGFGEHGTRAFLTAITNNTENRSVEQIKREMQSAYEAGRVGTPVNRIAEYLQSDMQIDAYTAGKQDALADLSKNKVQAPFATVYSPDESGLDRSIKYKGIPSRTLSIMDTIGKALGAKVQISDTVVASTVKDNDGNDVVISANGSHTDGVIKVARDAEDPALVVMGHEGAHRMKLLAPEEYSLFENYAVETMAAKRNVPYQTLVEAYRSNATSSKIELSVGQAMEEISADFAGQLFKDPVLLQDFINEGKKPENRNWVQRFFDVIADIVNTITGKKNKAKAKAMQDVADYLGIEIEQVQKAIDLWEQAYTAAAAAVQTRQESSDVSQVGANQSAVKELSENGIGYDADTQTVYSLRYSPVTVKDVIERQNRVESLAKMVADTTHRSIEDARKWVKAEMSIANLIMSSPDFLAVADYEADDRYEAIKSNSDYPQGTVDFVNLCPKRKEFTKIFDVLQKTYPNRLFTATDVAGMRQILSDHDIIVACGLCFVEDRRQLLGEIADTFINMWKTAIDTNSPVKKTNANGEAKIMHVTKRIADQYGVTKGASVYAKDKYVPTQYDLTTYEGFKHLQANHPTVAMTYEMYNNSRGQQAGRLIEGRAEYKRQILSWSDARVKRVNDNGGLRIFSFSDFEVEHLLDLVQVILDCSARGVKIQGYTKIPEFAKLIRDTGIKLNRSLIPKGKTGLKLVNGKTVLDIDNVEGMNMESENFLDESVNPNVGNVIVGINDEQIRVAMTDDFIDYIIPFHSNKSKAVCVALGLEGWDNYKNDQHDKNKSTGKAAKSNINIYTEVIDKYNPKNKVEFVEAFLDVCKQKNIEPRFSRFLNKDANGDYVYTEGYHKFLVDFKLFDAEGNILPQQTIVPNLDEKFMSDLIKDEATELKNYKFPQEVYDEIEAKYGKAETSDADNANLTEKPDTQFSLKKPVEQTDKLVAVHGLTMQNLIDTLKLGGFPSPSIAIVKALEGHNKFGAYSAVFNKNTIDPEHDPRNKVYGSDAYTPTAPQIDYEVNYDKLREIEKSIDESAKKIAGGIFGNTSAIRRHGVEDTYSYSPEHLALQMSADDAVRAAYLAEKGETLEPVYKTKEYSKFGNEALQTLIDRIGAQRLAAAVAELQTDNKVTSEAVDVARNIIRESWEAKHAYSLNQKPELKQSRINRYMENNVTRITVEDFISDAWTYYEEGGTATEEIDRKAMLDALFQATDTKDVTQWVLEKLDGLFVRKGIYNDKDPYTPSGRRKSWEALHYEYTLENIVRAMVEAQEERGGKVGMAASAKSLQAVASPKYRNISEIKADSHKLGKVDGEGYEARVAEVEDSIEKAIAHVRKGNKPHADNEFEEHEIIASVMMQAASGKRTVDAIVKAFKAEGYEISTGVAQEIQSVYTSAANLPTEYFEAKPQRVVGFDEVAAIIAPDDIPTELKAQIENAGMTVLTYKTGDDADRTRVLNSLQDVQFSLKGQSDLLKENKRLRERIDELKRQMTVTTVAKVNKKQLASYTRRILNGYDSNADFDTTKEALDNLYTYIANGEADGTPPVWEEAYKQAREIARNVVEKASVLEDTDYTQYRELRDYLRKTPLVMPKQNRGDFDAYGGWNNFRKRNMGKVNLANNGVPIDSAYQELAILYPGFFNEEEYTNPVDQLLNMLDVYERLRPYEINPFAGVEEGAIAELANDIMEMFFDIPQARPTFADRQQRELTKLKAKYGKRLENMSRREMVAKILRHIQPMSQKLLRPTDKQHIPQGLRDTVATLLNAINLEGKYTIDEKTGKRTASGEGKPTKRTEAFLALKQQYLAISQNESSDMVIDPALLGEGVDGTNLFDEVIAMGNIRLSDMSKEQLDTVWRVIRAVEHSITSAGRMLAQGKFETTMEAAEAIRRDTASRKGKNSLTKKHVSLDLFDPYTFFSQYGEAGHSLYRMLRDAQDKTILWTNELAERTQDIASLETRQELESEKSATTFSVAGGQLTLTKAQIMNLYLLDKRGQAKGHLVSLVGGIVQPEIGKKVKRGTDSTIVTQEDVENIINSLTDDEKAIADKYQRLTKWLAEKGNNASMQVYGYEKFNDPNYWTIISAKEQLNQTVEKGNDNPRSIKNMGSAKAINPEANNAVELLSMFDLFDKHASDMLTYSAWLAPMEDMNRLFNFKYRDEMGNITNATFKGLLNRIGGENSDQYWLNLMKDIQNGISIKTSNLGSYAWKIYGNVKAASVGYNLRVVAQQPMAYFRASILLNPVSMAQGAIKGATNGNGWSKALKYAPVALMKQMGGFEIAANQRGLSEQLNVAETKKGKLFDFIKQSPFWLAGKADEVTWGAIWNACEWEIANKQKNLERGSELYYRAVAELFTEIVDQTQVVDGVLQRSAIMRSANTLDRQASAFMGEPIKSLNVLIRAYSDFRYETNGKKRKDALKKVARAAGTLALTNIMTAIAQSLIDAARDDDEEKDYWERFVKAYVGIGGDEGTLWDIVKSITLEGNLVETSNPATWIPYANDIMSILKGFDVERMDAGALGDVINATMQAIQTFGGEGKWTVPYAMTQVAENVAKMFGIPVSSLIRDVETITRSIIIERNDWEGLYNLTKTVYDVNKKNASRFIDILYQAYKDGDTEAYNAISRDLVEQGVEPSQIESGIKSRAKKKAEEGTKKTPTEPTEEEYYSIDNLDGYQYTTYFEEKEDIYDDILKDFDSMGIDKLDDETEKALLDAAMKYARETALEKASNGEYDSDTEWINKAQNSEEIGLTLAEYLMLKEEYGATSIGADGVYEAYNAGADVESYLEFKKLVSDLNKEKEERYNNGETDISKTATKAETVDIIMDMGVSDDVAWALYSSKYDSKSDKAADAHDIPVDLYLEAVVGLGNIEPDYNRRGEVKSGSKRKKVEEYLEDLCGGKDNRNYWFLLAIEYPSVKKDRDYIAYFGKEES